MVWPRADEVIGLALERYGEFAESENRLMARYVEPGAVVLDVGANLGTTVMSLARQVGDGGEVVAFEPQPLMAQCLHTSLTLNQIFNVRVLSVAVSDRSGWVRMAAQTIDSGGNYGAVAIGEQGLCVPAVRLDDMDIERCDLLKIDVEGHEWNVIQGAQKMLVEAMPVVYFESKRNPGTVACLDWLMRNGWRCYWHFAFFFGAENFRAEQRNVFGPRGDINVLAVPAHRQVPDDLPQIRLADEDWEASCSAFVQQRGVPLP